MAPTKAPPVAYRSFGEGSTELVDPDPLVVEMLGLADRSRIFDLFEAVMRGRIAEA